MPYTWDYSKCKDWKKTLRRKRRKGELGYSNTETQYVLKEQYQTVINAAMHIGIPRITKANYKKFYYRVRLYETLKGTQWFKEVRGKMVEIPTKLEDVERMIGLHTNGSSYGAGEFHKRYIKKYV
tara:strand:- start:1194 stop:1568 length:375 start_codon:yes stop_codon:yes gene_type:complete